MQQLPLGFPATLAPSLGDFAPGPNAHVIGLLRQWLAGGLAMHSLYLWGPAGVGKTHLLRASVDEVAGIGRAGRYLAAGMALAPECAMGLHLLAVDDVGQLAVPSQAVLFTLLNQAAEQGPRLLLAGDNAPAGLGLRADVTTRISHGLVLQVRALTDADKHEALRQHAQARGFELAPEAAEYLLRHGQRDLPSLMRVLEAADRYSLQEQRAVTATLLREVLQQDRADR